MIGFFTLGFFLFLMILRAPIGLSMGAAALVGLAMVDYPLQMIPAQVVSAVQATELLAVPFFILVGNIANAGGLTTKIFDFAATLVGHWRGGLAHVNVLASMIFAGMSGAGVADIAGLGIIEMKAMTDRGYEKAYSAAITIASAVIGPIIPPSIPMVIYAIIADASVGRVLLAGALPGVVIGIFLMIVTRILVGVGWAQLPTEPRAPFREVVKTFAIGFWALLTPLVLLSGFVLGVVTPSEAGILASVYAIIIGFIYRTLTIKKLTDALKESLTPIAQIMFLIAMAGAMRWLIAAERVPITIGEWVLAVSAGKPFVFLLMINAFYLVMGCFMHGLSTLIITLPIFLPLLETFQIDPVHFGVVTVFNAMIGMCTPPVGMGLFIITSVTDVRYDEVTRKIYPLVGALLLALLIVTFVPQISLWLPNLLMGK